MKLWENNRQASSVDFDKILVSFFEGNENLMEFWVAVMLKIYVHDGRIPPKISDSYFNWQI